MLGFRGFKIKGSDESFGLSARKTLTLRFKLVGGSFFCISLSVMPASCDRGNLPPLM